ncbi:MAG TPA: DUF4178 domain-containing protein [Puia sp.]|nr:DUF4178 domain-containing protein [Puia sp.]
MGKVTGIYQCPACSRTVTYRSGNTRLIVCSCGQALNRLESDDLIIKSVSIIQDHNDWLRVGASGVFEKRKFEVLGRFRCWLDESVYNYWTIYFYDNSLAILAEGYGMYAIMQRLTPEKTLEPEALKGLKMLGSIPLLQEEDCFLQRKDSCWKYEIEGEVWMPECSDQFPIFGLSSTRGRHFEILEFLPNYMVVYELHYRDYKSLKLTGFNEGPTTSKNVSCPSCHNTIVVKTWPYAQSCACTNCGTRLAFKHGPEFQSAGKDKLNANRLSIPLGATGIVKDISYEVIGYTLKQDSTPEHSRWSEYVLYNRAEGYAFLSEYAGNWLYAREQGNYPILPEEDPVAIYYKGEQFQLYNAYSIQVIDAAGEFPFNIYDDTTALSSEFIAPPRMWIYEKSTAEGINWFTAEHQDHKQLAAAFSAELPPKTEMGVLEPSGYMSLNRLLKVTLIAVAVLVGIHLLIGFGKQNKVLLQQDVTLKDSVASTTFVTSKFDLTKWHSNLQFDINAPVDNSWLDMSASLVNNSTGQEYHVEQLVQYYHGYDDGESWNEGSPTETAYLTSIPAGTYFLRIEADKDTTGNSSWNGLRQFSLTVTSDVPSHRNLFIFLGLLLLWPIISFIRLRATEKRRWGGSKYSPYKA